MVAHGGILILQTYTLVYNALPQLHILFTSLTPLCYRLSEITEYLVPPVLPSLIMLSLQ